MTSARRLGSLQRYRLFEDADRRRSPSRLQIDRSDTDWKVLEYGERFAEVPAPMGLAPQLVLHGPTGPWVVLNHFASSADGRPLRRVLAKPVEVVDGNVFARLRADYRYTDAEDRSLFLESYEASFYGKEQGQRIIDLGYAWSASSHPIVLFDPRPDAPATCPKLEVRRFGDSTGAAAFDKGKDSGPAGRVFDGGMFALVRSMTVGFPPTWVQRDSRTLEIHPDVSRARMGDAVRLALGERYEARFRLAVSRRPISATASAAEWDEEPVVRVSADVS
jgi:hypothetical protein